jgi:hypothetical protein
MEAMKPEKVFIAIHLPPLLTIKRIIVWDVDLVEQQQAVSQVVAKAMEVAVRVVVTG